MYGRLALSLAASAVVMYALAFSQIDVLEHFEPSLSVAWITVTMVSAMGLIMLLTMHSMFPRRGLNVALAAVFGLGLLGGIAASRTEALVGDDAFLHSMIPHHSRAIHMCQEAGLTDPQILRLCDGIVATQREEIREMNRILDRRDR